MDWANVTKIHTSPFVKCYFSSLTSMRRTKTILRPGQECILAPRGRIPFGADQKEGGLWAQNAGRDLENAQSHC